MLHTLQAAQPCPELRPFVRSYAQRQMYGCEIETRQAVPSRLEQTLEFQFRDSFTVEFSDGRELVCPRTVIVGLYTGRADILLGGEIESFAIFFQPTGLSELFRIPVNELTNRNFEAVSVLGRSVSGLWERLADKSFRERVSIAETFLLAWLHEISTDSVIQAARYLFLEQGCVRISDLAFHCGIGRRQFERRFQGELGISPKLFARVARFQAALDAKITRPDTIWLTIAHDLGYHDQMHMIREFKELGGGAPGLLVQQILDGRPPAMISDRLIEFDR